MPDQGYDIVKGDVEAAFEWLNAVITIWVRQNPSRAASITLTELETAQLWFTKVEPASIELVNLLYNKGKEVFNG